MTIENAIKAIAGFFILTSISLGVFVNPNWFYFTTFVGLNLFQSSFTHWCLMEKILKAMGLKHAK